LPLYLLAYGLFPYFLPHYLTVIAPVIVLGIVLGIQTLCRIRPSAAGGIRWGMAGVIVVTCILTLPGIAPGARDERWIAPTLELNARLPQLVRQPALVLFRYHPDSSPHEEPVYNVDVAWPDDAPIVRAHDLGPEANMRLVRYYARHQPGRHLYRVDRGTGMIGYLGIVSKLAGADLANLPATRPLPPVDGL
jgi:hypothetical protein